MAGLNKVLLIGNLGEDPKIKILPKGTKMASFSLATSEWYEEAKKKVTEWHTIELWDSLAESCEFLLKKGDLVFIQGKIRTSKWEDKLGNERKSIKIVASQFQLLKSMMEHSQQVEEITDIPKPHPDFLTEEDDFLPF